MQIVILAGGLGTRLKPITNSTPKSMVLILGKPFIQYQIELLKKNGLHNIVMCIGYNSDQIEQFLGNGKKFDIDIVYSKEGPELMGTAGALKNAEHLLGEEFFLMNGDSYLPIDFSQPYKPFKMSSKLALMTVYKNEDRYDRSNVVVEGQRVVKYDRSKRWPRMIYIDYGLRVFKKEVLKYVPRDTRYQLDQLYHRLIDMNQLMAYEFNKRFYEIGSLRGLESFKAYAKRLTTKRQ